MRVLLTGASGFAGAHMFKKLIHQQDIEIVYPVTYTHGGNVNRIKDLVGIETSSNAIMLERDLALDKLSLNSLNIDLVINYASESHVDRSIFDPAHVIQNNFLVVFNLLESIRESRRNIPFFHVSTDEVYGEITPGTEVYEWRSPLHPSNPYSASKAIQEQMIISYNRTFNVSACIFNATNMIGETQNAEKFLPKVIQNTVQEQTIFIDTDRNGTVGSRKYLYAGDVADGIWIAIESLLDTSRKPNFLEKFHLSGSSEFSNEDIVKLVGKYLSREQSLVWRPSPRNGYDLRYDLNSDKMREMGWKETAAIPDRISQVIQWTLLHPNWLTADYQGKIN